MNKDEPETPFLSNLAPWNDNENSIWLASTLLLHRNIEKFYFPSKLDLDKRRQIVSLVGKQIPKISSLKKPTFLKTEECSALDREFLVEHCLSGESFLQSVQGEAFVFDGSGKSILSVNIEDHLHFHYIDIHGEIEKGWNQISQVEMELGKAVSYAFSPKFGFLTSRPFVAGTGLTVSLFLQLSGLIHSGRLEAIRNKFSDEPIEISGLVSTSDSFIGDLVVIQNQYSLGVNEESIISLMRNLATKIVVEETSTRAHIKQEGTAEIKDKVARAFGLLTHSYQIEAQEALNEIALVKFGLEMGWIQGVSLKELNTLFFRCRRAHLLREYKDKVPIEEIPHKRAEFIHKALKEVELLI